MKLDYQLKLEQTQKLILTPELKLAITLLQYSTVELLDFVQQELLENPVLEMFEGEVKAREEIAPDKQEQEERREDEFPWEDYLRDTGTDQFAVSGGASFREQYHSIENYPGEEKSMVEDLLEQLRLLSLAPEEYAMAAYLVGNLDSNGYLRGELGELAVSPGVTVEELEQALAIVQSLEPTGVGSRNLRECLMLQLNALALPPPLAVDIVRRHLPAAADGRYRHIASCLGCDQQQVQEAVAFIRTLNPKPGNIYGAGVKVRYIVPDLIVEKVSDDYVVTINDGSTPHLIIDPFYREILKDGFSDDRLTGFIKSKLERALWLIRSIEQRRLTLYRVATAVVAIQRKFLDEGIKMLRPLTLKEVAGRVGLHESTVSRATANKYIQTPRGLFPIKFFFCSGLPGLGGKDHSSLSIKSHLRDLIEQDDLQKPFSDKQLAGMLKQRGIVISRRTVAKYREEIDIPPSHKRRRLN